ncbi:MAG: hypothetical protein HFJ06_07885 [Lachnospiraceae bacterium]|nr:hypothetical protein [Lachnospiraceae bacterium]
MKKNKEITSDLVITYMKNGIKVYLPNIKTYEYLKSMVKEEPEDLLEIQRIREKHIYG